MTQRRRKQLLYLAVDLLTAILVWISFLLFRWLVYEGRLLSMDQVWIPAFDFWRPMLMYPMFCLVVYYLSGAYMRPSRRRPTHEISMTLVSSAVIAMIAFFAIAIDDDVKDTQNYYTSLLVLFGLQVSLSYIGRLIVSLCTHAYEYRPVTYSFPEAECLRDNLVLPADTERVLVKMNKKVDEQRIYTIISKLYPKRVQIAFTARTYDILAGRARVEDLAGQPIVDITSMPMSDMQLAIKRAFDVVMSAICLVLLSPVMAVIAIAVKMSSPGPVIYKQERIGHYGQPFMILKFRTMSNDAEGGQPMLTSDDDPRVTKVGKVLRQYRLDEIPQFWNILRGEMSIVGPRPEREYYIRQIEEKAPYYCLIYKMRPGLTSWGPIKVGYTDTLEKMVERLNYDITYMENMSLRLDVKIMLHTLGVIVGGKGK